MQPDIRQTVSASNGIKKKWAAEAGRKLASVEANVGLMVEEGVVPECSVAVVGEPKPATTEKFVLQGYAPNMMVETTVAIGTGFVVESTEVEPSYLWTATEGSVEGNATSDGMALDLDDPAVTTVRLLRPRRPPLPHSRPTSPARGGASARHHAKAWRHRAP